MIDIKRILVPVDFSYEAHFALQWAITLLKNKPNSTIVLYHVAEVTPDYPVPTVDCSINDFGLKMEKRKSYLEHWLEKIPTEIHSDFLIGRGAIVSEINRYCHLYKIDLIVMVARDHHTLFSRWVRHNTCENIVRGASCPVLVLHHGRSAPQMSIPPEPDHLFEALTPQL